MNLVPNPYTRRIKYLALFSMLFDLTLTLIGQSETYWSSSGVEVNEANELFHYFSSHGSLSFVASLLAYVAIMFGLITYVPTRIAYVGSLALIFGHYYGACSWLTWDYGVQAAVVYAIFLASILVYAEGKFFKNSET
ncbi:hypothetical protein ST37_07875 [Vibrio sp. qd031]|uniref:hypothetical protein n=1 Tax=Vibrio sp. qd031 TaxID=1603038 RepID=UPI000A0FB187|nr:hypothetical protein [Vibrio sp. qd031]ORT50847.1 hypothetical protein ST37_07875 [Vibrio sp. qd031]